MSVLTCLRLLVVSTGTLVQDMRYCCTDLSEVVGNIYRYSSVGHEVCLY